ncbi:MAG: hypothetical protein WD336_02575 [Trueperaceae bacterium]
MRSLPAPSVLALYRASRVLVASVEPFALWAHRWGRLDARAGGADPPGRLSTRNDRTVDRADPAARAAGVRRGMTVAGARQRLPGVAVVPSAGPAVDAAWDAFLDEMHDVAPRVAPLRTGVVAWRGPTGDAVPFAERTGARVGAADTIEEAWLLAYLAAPGQAATVPPGSDPWPRLDRAPVRLLGGIGLDASGPDDSRSDGPALDRGDLERLAWLGVRTIGALRRWTPAQLRAWSGAAGPRLVRVLHGPRNDRIPARTPAPVIVMTHAFDDAVTEPWRIGPIVQRLAERAARALHGRDAERLRVRVRAGGLRSEAVRRAKEPLHRPDAIVRLAWLALDETRLAPFGIDDLTLELSGLARTATQGELWQQHRRAARAAHAVHARFPGQARRFVPHDPYALRSRQRWRLLDAATGDPLAWGATDDSVSSGRASGEHEVSETTTDGDSGRPADPHGADQAKRPKRAILTS